MDHARDNRTPASAFPAFFKRDSAHPVRPSPETLAAVFLFACLALPRAAGGELAKPPAGKHGDAPAIAQAPMSDWPKYCGNLEMTGLSPTGFEDPGAVPRLDLLWSRDLSGSVASAPSVSGGVVYVGDWGGTFWALDQGTGAVIATVELGRTEAPQCSPDVIGITSSPAIVDGTLYVAGGDAYFYALDAKTLAILWRTQLGDNSPEGGYYGWCSPAVLGGRVFQGVSSNCDDPFVPGQLVALDTTTGNRLLTTNFEPPLFSGGGVWTSPAVDAGGGSVYVTTASAYHFYDGYAYSIVQLALDDLSYEASWHIPPSGVLDSDWGSSPTLFVDASGRRLVGAGQKDGHYYCFERDAVARGPVWAAAVTRGGDSPQDGQGTLSTAAFDGNRLYLGGGALPTVPIEQQGGSAHALDPTTGEILWQRTFDAPVIAPISAVRTAVFVAAGTEVLALDPATGDTIWSYRTKALCYGGIAVAGDTLFVGDLSGTLYAFAAPPRFRRSPPVLPPTPSGAPAARQRIPRVLKNDWPH